MEGPDHKASLDTAEFAEMTRQIRAIEVALGTGVKWPNPSEERIKPLVRRKIVAARDLSPDTTIGWEDLSFKRVDHGINADQADAIIGKTLKVGLTEDMPVDWHRHSDLSALCN